MSRRQIMICNRCRREQPCQETDVPRPTGWMTINMSDNPRAVSNVDLCAKCSDELRNWIVSHE